MRDALPGFEVLIACYANHSVATVNLVQYRAGKRRWLNRRHYRLLASVDPTYYAVSAVLPELLRELLPYLEAEYEVERDRELGSH